MLQMTLIIKGTVQKVGFRYSVVDFVNTQGLGLVGSVRNLPDGSVKVVAQGELESLKVLYNFCTKGPPRAEVREVDEELVKIKAAEYSEFCLIAE
jgi:acylphosphatase